MTKDTEMFVDYYSVLELDVDATLEEVRAAYRTKVRLSHPDLVGEGTEQAWRNATDVTARLNEAYECLSDSERRRVYDARRRADSESGKQTPATLIVSPGTARCEATPGDTVRLKLDVQAHGRTGRDGFHVRAPHPLAIRGLRASKIAGGGVRLDLRLDTSGLTADHVYQFPIHVISGHSKGTVTLEVRTSGRGADDSIRRPPIHGVFRRRRPERMTRAGASRGRLMRLSIWALVCTGLVFLGLPAAFVIFTVLSATPFLGLLVIGTIFGRDPDRRS